MKNMIHQADIQSLLDGFHELIKTHTRAATDKKRAVLEVLAALATTAGAVIAAFELAGKPAAADKFRNFFLDYFQASTEATIKAQCEIWANS